MKRALILGVTGQDGSYMAELLLEKGYAVHGMIRRSATDNTRNIKHLISGFDHFHLHQGDLADPLSIHSIIQEVRPQEIYNEADQDNVGWSRATPAYSVDITAGAVARLCESVKMIDPTIRISQPVSSTMFGNPTAWPQDENTELDPRSPYACAKSCAFYFARHYRREHGLFVSTAIRYNHTSVRQSEDYLLPKICRTAVRLSRGEQDYLALGNLENVYDIGWAPDVVEASWAMLQADKPDDYVISTWYARPIEFWVKLAFKVCDVEMGRVIADDHYWGPPDPTMRCGNYHKAADHLDYFPETPADEIVFALVDDYERELACV